MSEPTPLFLSFIPMLDVCCKLLKPKVYVEWGPGVSTEFILKTTDLEVYAWESHPSWYKHLNKKYAEEKRVHLFQGRVGLALGHKEVYANAPMLEFAFGSLDVMLVDGRHRADCMICAYHLLKDEGVAILHDAERRCYEPGKDFFPHRFEVYDERVMTGIYSKSEETIQKVKEEYERRRDDGTLCNYSPDN